MKMLMLFWYTPSSDQNYADYVNGPCSICSCSTNWLPWWYTKHNLPMLFPQLGCLPHPWANQSGEIGQCLKPLWLHASIIIIPVPLSQVQRCLSVNPITYWMAALIWDTVVSLAFVTIAACIIQAFQVIASTFTLIIITSFIMSIYHLPHIAFHCLDLSRCEVSLEKICTISLAGAKLHFGGKFPCRSCPHASLLPGEVPEPILDQLKL